MSILRPVRIIAALGFSLLLASCASAGKNPDSAGLSVEDTLISHQDDFRECYARSDRRGNGTIDTAFSIDKDGRVKRPRIVSSTLHQPDVEKCVLETIRGLSFAPPKGGGRIDVTYPFKFHSQP